MHPNPVGLFQLQEFIRRVLALNLPDALWVRAEIGQLKSSRGHLYLDLVEKQEGGDEWAAQAAAVIWSGTYKQLRKTLGPSVESLLQQGMEILVKARVDYHERYGLKLLIEAIDPAYTLGRLAIAQQEKRKQIEAEGLIGKNGLLPLPPALQRIAVISSAQAAGWQDFEQQLQHNPYGYRFYLQLFPAAMQGTQLEPEVLAQLGRISAQAQRFDAVAILRGGGARLDLAGFDSVALCRAIAAFPLPVFTGIGHEIDQTLTDLTAHTALKTPTALAAFLIQHNLDFEARLLDWGAWLKDTSRKIVQQHLQYLEQQRNVLKTLAASRLVAEHRTLREAQLQVPLHARYLLKTEKAALDSAEKICALLSIESTLRRGFSITLLHETPLRSAGEVQVGTTITTVLAEGTIESVVQASGNPGHPSIKHSTCNPTTTP
ncbi:MAG: exodeoxyribonuclease VII large subunit [Saprospiraceae bacterium]|jgi:exodeoxyribonuclease VII large subunit